MPQPAGANGLVARPMSMIPAPNPDAGSPSANEGSLAVDLNRLITDRGLRVPGSKMLEARIAAAAPDT
jgi:hypothetical protein